MLLRYNDSASKTASYRRTVSQENSDALTLKQEHKHKVDVYYNMSNQSKC